MLSMLPSHIIEHPVSLAKKKKKLFQFLNLFIPLFPVSIQWPNSVESVSEILLILSTAL